jgi:hypothetical protein
MIDLLVQDDDPFAILESLKGQNGALFFLWMSSSSYVGAFGCSVMTSF